MARWITRSGDELNVRSLDLSNRPEGIVACENNGTYFVLATQEGDLFDVTDVTVNPNAKDRTRANAKYKLFRCNKACFDAYMMFLKHRSKGKLAIARREFVS